MTVVIDASVVVAALVDAGTTGQWAAEIISSGDLMAPHLMPAEVANILRRAVLANQVGSDHAILAHNDLLSLRVQLVPYEPFADRIWELHRNLTCYDAWYVAVAEATAAPLATLDRELSRAPLVTCEFVHP